MNKETSPHFINWKNLINTHSKWELMKTLVEHHIDAIGIMGGIMGQLVNVLMYLNYFLNLLVHHTDTPIEYMLVLSIFSQYI